jgi:PAS domain S-box-containing protein
MGQIDTDLYWVATILQFAAIIYAIRMLAMVNDRRPWLALLFGLVLMLAARVMALTLPLETRQHTGPFIAPLLSCAFLIALFTMRQVAVAERESRAIADARTKERDESEKRYHSLVELSPDAILVFVQDQVVYANAAAATLFGFENAGNLLQRQSSQMLCPQSSRTFAREARMLHEIGQTLPASEQAWLRRDGGSVYVDVVAAMVPWHGGVATQYILRDASERKRVEQQRAAVLADERAARSAAEHASRMKDEFLATLSHELRTPLNAILGWSQVLRRTPNASADVTQGLDTIERNAKAQTRLIEDLLDMSRITSGKLSLTISRVTPSEIITAAMETVRHAADAKGVTLHFNFDFSADTVMADPSRLQQVIWNLLTNAVKFTPAGGNVNIELHRKPGEVRITVTDTGQGIPAHFLPQVFERFKQADSTTTRRHGGLGLGLAIARQLVEMHGGTLSAASDGEGRGSTFTIVLPSVTSEIPALRGIIGDGSGALEADQSSAQALAQISEHVRQIDLSGLKILVVDDEADTRALIKRFLDKCNAQVITAASAREGMERIEQDRPDVLVSDIGMPEIDGYEFLRQVRLRDPERGGKIPAVALTAFARSEDRTRALLAGYTVHISKPVEAEEFLATLASVTGRMAATTS